MSFFSRILAKLGFGDCQPESSPPPASTLTPPAAQPTGAVDVVTLATVRNKQPARAVAVD